MHFFALFLQLSALQALCSVHSAHCVHYFSTFQETTFQGGTIDGANYSTSRVCLYVFILNFVFCIFKAAQEMMQMMPTSRVFCAIQDKRGCEWISLLWCNLFSNRATTLMEIMKMLKMIKMFKELKCCKCSTGGQRLQTAGGAFRLVQDSKLALEQIPFGRGATILQIIPAQEQISTYTSIFSVNLCHKATLGHYPGKLHRLFWNMSIPPAPKLNVATDLKIFRLIYDCQIGKVFESPTGLEQGTSCPLDMPWLPLPGCAGDQNNLEFTNNI